MLGKVQTLDRRFLNRRCLSCGYDGILLRGGTAERCARCGCDLSRRPARSYAEMEGLLGQPLTLHSPQYEPLQQCREERLVHRWLVFLFLAMIGFVALAYLSAAALTV